MRGQIQADEGRGRSKVQVGIYDLILPAMEATEGFKEAHDMIKKAIGFGYGNYLFFFFVLFCIV